MRTLQFSFVSGEISPEMQGRPDLQTYASGVATMQNMTALPQGAATRRPGMSHVDTVTDEARQSRLIPFRYSDDQAYAVQLSQDGITMYADGQRLNWADPIGRQVETVDVTLDRITFARRHGLTTNDAIQFLVTVGGGLIGLTAGTTYYANVVDAETIYVSATIGGAALALSALTSGTVYAYRDADLPAAYYSGPVVSAGGTWNQPSSFVGAAGHPFVDGDAVRLYDGGSAVWPGLPPLQEAVTYYVTNAGPGVFQMQDADGQTIDFSAGATVSGTFNIYRYYEVGELVSHNGATTPDAGVYYASVGLLNSTGGPSNVAWIRQPMDGQLVIPSPYTESELPTIRYAQSNDVLTLTCPTKDPKELRRRGATHWDLQDITFGAALPPPVTGGFTVTYGKYGVIQQIYNVSSVGHFEFSANHNLAREEPVFIIVITPGGGLTTTDTYIVDQIINDREVRLKTRQGVWLSASTSAAMEAQVYSASLAADTTQRYKVTAVDADYNQSLPSAEYSVINNLDVSGASNTLLWYSVYAAERYFIYREENGIFAFLGQSDTTSFTDDGSSQPDGSLTPPIQDESLDSGAFPRAVGYIEQRRFFGGTVTNPRGLYGTRTGTEADLTFRLPLRDSDRVSATLAARENVVIQHIVPMREMLVLSQQGEWLVTSADGGGITPFSILLRQQSETGSSDVRPLVVNTTVVFCAARGGHVRELGFSWQSQSYTTGDLSYRASHLFDGFTIDDAALSKAPWPLLAFASTSGKLLMLSYVPEEGVGAWSQHTTAGGVVESLCSIPEGNVDTFYLSVRRTVNGATRRYIERMVPEVTEDIETSVHLDACSTFDGLTESSATVTVAGGFRWSTGETLALTASATAFAASDVGADVELRDTAGGRYRIEITAVSSGTAAQGLIRTTIPSALRDTAVSTWGFARKVLRDLDHLNGETITVVSDGTVIGTKAVADGQVSLSTAGVTIHGGHNYISEIKTLPLAAQVEAAGRGRLKNIGRAHVRVLDTAGLKVGPAGGALVSLEGMNVSALNSGEKRATLPGNWDVDGQVRIVQDQPLPTTVVGLTLEVDFGG